jgi:hypothetical protein
VRSGCCWACSIAEEIVTSLEWLLFYWNTRVARPRVVTGPLLPSCLQACELGDQNAATVRRRAGAKTIRRAARLRNYPPTLAPSRRGSSRCRSGCGPCSRRLRAAARHRPAPRPRRCGRRCRESACRRAWHWTTSCGWERRSCRPQREEAPASLQGSGASWRC